MRQLCFDTESDYFKSPTISVGEPEDHRQYFRERENASDSDCAVVYDSQTRRYRQFSNTQVDALVELLAAGDELVSHSGKWVDLIVLEHACGDERIAPLWKIPHHDLFEIFPLQSVDALARRFIPEKRIAEWEAGYQRRQQAAMAQWPSVNGWNRHKQFIAVKLAKARFDVQRTFAVFGATRRTIAK